jgi:hypothetical protein
MIMRKKTLTVIGGLALLGGGALLVSKLGNTAKEHARPERVAESMRADEPHGPCDFQVAEELSYALAVESNAIVRGDRMGAAGSAPVTRKVEAKLALETLSADGEGAVLLARFSPVRVDGADAKLDEPFLLRVRECRVEGFARHTGTPSTDARTVQGLAYELGYTALAAGETRRVEGDDTAGHYRAAFASEGSKITRRIEAYTTLWDGSALPVAPGAVIRPSESASTIMLDDGRWFATLTRHEVLSGVAAADIDQTLRVKRAEVDGEALSTADRDLGHYVWENLLPRVAFRRAKREVTRKDLEARKAVQDHSLEEEVADFVVRSRSLPNFAETWPPLATYLEARPEMTRPLAHALRTGVVPPDGRAGGWLAIGNARTEEAKAVLLETMRDPSALAINRTRAMFAMVDRDDVGVELTREMASQALTMSTASDNEGRFFARESALAMGMMAGLRGETEPAVLDVALSTARQLLSSQKTASDLHPVFGSIANIGHPSMLALTRPYTQNPDAKVRAGAALVFRRLSPLASNDFVAEWLGRETDLTVKRELYTTLWKQSHDARMAVGAAVLDRAIVDLAAKPSIIARRAIIKLLGEAAATYLPARRALMAQATIEAKQRTGLYTVIAQYLGADDLSAGLAQGQVGP